MQFSKYQMGVFDWFENQSSQYASVDSVAGSGKTFTGIEGMKRADMFARKLFGCFNSHIQQELEVKVKPIMNAAARTYNSLGWEACRDATRCKLQKDEKTSNILKYKLLPNTGGMLSDADFKIFCRLRGPIQRLVSLCKADCCFTVDEALQHIPELIDFHDIDVPSPDDKELNYAKFMDYFARTYDLSINTTYFMDYDDQIYQPLRKGWPLKKWNLILIDEFQDTTEMQSRLLQSALARDGRIAVFGDDDQVIYEFRGSEEDTMKKWREKMGATHLPLSICYRCPISVVKEAQGIVPRIEWADSAINGVVDRVKRTEMRQRVQDGDYILCRTNAELMGEVIYFVSNGRKAYVRGKDVGENLIEMVNKIVGPSDCPIDFLLVGLQDHVLQMAEFFKKIDKEDKIELLQDKAQMIRLACQGCSYVEQVRDKITAIFTDPQKEGICCMSSHKSKGLQNPRVWVLKPEKLADNWNAKKDWQKRSQRRLRYVTITRAQEELHWVETEKNQEA